MMIVGLTMSMVFSYREFPGSRNTTVIPFLHIMFLSMRAMGVARGRPTLRSTPGGASGNGIVAPPNTSARSCRNTDDRSAVTAGMMMS